MVLSTTKAKYVAVIEAFKEALQLLSLFDNLGAFREHVDVYCNSQSAIELAKIQVYHSKMKHINVQFHFIREILDEGNILLRKISTADNLDVMLTELGFGVKF